MQLLYVFLFSHMVIKSSFQSCIPLMTLGFLLSLQCVGNTNKDGSSFFLSVGCWIITESTKMVFFVFDILCKLHKESYPFDSEHEKKNPLINMFLCVCVCGVRVSL